MREFITAILPSEFILFYFSPTVLPAYYIYSRALSRGILCPVAYLILGSHWFSSKTLVSSIVGLGGNSVVHCICIMRSPRLIEVGHNVSYSCTALDWSGRRVYRVQKIGQRSGVG